MGVWVPQPFLNVLFPCPGPAAFGSRDRSRCQDGVRWTSERTGCWLGSVSGPGFWWAVQSESLARGLAGVEGPGLPAASSCLSPWPPEASRQQLDLQGQSDGPL